MKDAPAYDWFPERFWFAVEGWTDLEIVAYKRLLDQQWLRDGLPTDERTLAGLCRCRVPPSVLAKFPIATDGKRRNGFLETIRAKQRDRIEKRRKGAAMTNAQRWGSESLNGRSATIERQQSDPLSESPPLTTHHSPVKTADAVLARTTLGTLAAEIVALYPANGCEYDAGVCLLGALEAGDDPDWIRECVKIHAARWLALPPHRQKFCPMKPKYFRTRAWKDNPDASPWVDPQEPPKKKVY